MDAQDVQYSTEVSPAFSADGNATLDTFSSTGWIIASGIGFVLILAWMTNKLYRLKPPVDLLEGLDDIA